MWNLVEHQDDQQRDEKKRSRILPCYNRIMNIRMIHNVHNFRPLPVLLSNIKWNLQLNDLLSLGQHRVRKRMCISWSGATRGDRVLDLCCGSGDLTFLLSQKVGHKGKVYGLDFSTEQLSAASGHQELYWRASYVNIEWIEGNALDLPFSDCFFDAITIGYGLRNVIDRRNALHEVFRVLKPGSKVSILDFNKSASSLVKMMLQELNIDNVVVPVASNYGLSEEYSYLKTSIAGFLTGKELERIAKKVEFSKVMHFEIGGVSWGIQPNNSDKYLDIWSSMGPLLNIGILNLTRILVLLKSKNLY